MNIKVICKIFKACMLLIRLTWWTFEFTWNSVGRLWHASSILVFSKPMH